MTVGILGGGLTGLTISHHLKEKNIAFRILEKEKTCGGLMRSLKSNGFTFDFGGSHVIFSKEKDAVSFLLNLLGENKQTKKRKAAVLYKGHHIKYPFENGLAGLPPEENFECIYSYVKSYIDKKSSKKPEPNNLKQLFYYTFGDGITEKYLLPYNTKIWKTQPDQISCDWASRLPNPSLEDLLKSALGIETEGYLHQLNFFYPIQGGIQAITDNLTASIKDCVTTEFEIQKIRKEKTQWIVSNGTKEAVFEKIVSTIPINELITSMDAPKEVKNAIADLHYLPLISVMIGLNIENVTDLHWLYIPDNSVLPHRVSFPSNYSSKAAPSGKSSILAEITCQFDSNIWKMQDNEIADRVIDDLCRLNIIRKDNVCFSAVKRTKYAYVINDLKYSENMQLINNFLQKQQIDCIGRFGEFKYYNMDDCVKKAMNYVNNNF